MIIRTDRIGKKTVEVTKTARRKEEKGILIDD